VREVREFVRALRTQLARAEASEAGKLTSNQFKTGKEAKHISGRCAGLRMAGEIATMMLREMQDAADGGDLPEMED